MRRALVALLLSACSPAPPQQPLFDPARSTRWWQGTWVVDEARLITQARAEGLSPEAVRLAEALVREVGPEYAFELAPDHVRRKTHAGEQSVPAQVRVLGPDAVEVEGGELRLRLFRVKSGPILQEGRREIPVRRADEPSI